MEREFPSPGARLAAALLVGALPALTFFVGMLMLAAGEVVPVAFVSLALYVGCTVAIVVTTELTAMFGPPTARRVQGWALLPGIASLLIVLDNFVPLGPGAVAAALASLLVWQVLLRLWWRMAIRLTRRHDSAGPLPISP